MIAYPKPDRSRFTPNRVKTEANDTLDIGWAEGVMRGGRPWRAEAWCQDQVTLLTFFFSALGLEQATDADLTALLKAEDLVRFADETGDAGGRLAGTTLGRTSGRSWWWSGMTSSTSPRRPSSGRIRRWPP